MARSRPVGRADAIAALCRGKDVLDLGCVRHSAEYALHDPEWLHKRIREVARSVVGVDYLADEVAVLNEAGYEIVVGDVTEPLRIDRDFEVIVAGDLIEHLDNLRGFFENCSRLLAEDGSLVISTPNPFYCGEFHYVALKRAYLVNPEHTCWIDPLQLEQVASRFGFEVATVAMIAERWNPGALAWESAANEYDILTGRWTNDTFGRKVLRKITTAVTAVVYPPLSWIGFTRTALTSRSDYLAVLRKTPASGPGGPAGPGRDGLVTRKESGSQ